MRLISFVAILTVITFLFSCSDPIIIGAGLLDEDRADVGFTDTLSITATTVTNDSIRTYTPFTSSQLLNYLFGNLNDPLLGHSSASIYAQVYPENNAPRFGENTVMDSITLVLPYDVGGFYGKTAGQEFAMEIYQLAEVLQEDDEYFSNQEIAVEPMPIGAAQVVVSTDSLEFIDYDGTDTVAVRLPHYRLRLDEAVGNYLIGLDSAAYASDSLFFDAFKGIHLRPASENEGLLSFDLLSPNAGIYLYYRDSLNGKPKRFLYDFDIQPTVRFTNFKHNYDGSPAAPFLNNAELGDSLLFVQGMSGTEVKLEIPNVESLRGLVVNKAELEVYVADLEGDDEAFSPISQLVLAAPNSDGILVAVKDIEIILSQRRNLAQLFGGTPEASPNGGPAVYRMNISAHFQDIIDGSRENILYISAFEKAENGARSVLYGPGNSPYSVKLKLSFTKL